MRIEKQETIYQNEVLTRFELYNSLFQTLPFQKIKYTGALLPFFTLHCEREVENQVDPKTIIEDFFEKYGQYQQGMDKVDLLFRIIQYIERRVVLFDAIEDAAFVKTGRSEDAYLLGSLVNQAASDEDLNEKIIEKLKNFSLRLVLTAHPTQFYPGEVLGIITDLTQALKNNDLDNIVLLLQQLGKTPFIKKEKPTPVDEAISLAWFLENVFYPVISTIRKQLGSNFESLESKDQIIQLGFWPGGDRDGNPNVRVESTKEVSALLRTVLFRAYYRDFRVLRRRITFRGVEQYMNNLQSVLYDNSFNPADEPENVKPYIIENLEAIKDVLTERHNGLFTELVDDLALKVKTFGCYFASIDIRQDSSILRKAHQIVREQTYPNALNKEQFDDLSEQEKNGSLQFKETTLSLDNIDDPLVADTFDVIKYIKTMQKAGGELACHRFIISNCQQASDILQLMELFLANGWNIDELPIDFVPLFETVDDLERAANVMKMLYTHPVYQKHIKERKGQTIMLGFSDSTKDGGYLRANWSIYKAKIELTAVSREHEVDLTFFDGRGGPPARGGGKTQAFYASMGSEVENNHIELTIQGQTISSLYGSFDTAHYNIEQLLQAGLASTLNPKPGDTLNDGEKALIEAMADVSHKKFLDLRHHPLFLEYLEEKSPLKFLSEINISSRPVKRNGNSKLRLEDLRAISFVTSWSQLKQGIPGFYGVGSALENAEKTGKWDDVQALYRSSGMFKTIIDNCSMAMSKINFNITSHLAEDEKYGDFWKTMKEEYERTKKYLVKISNGDSLMDEFPVDRDSIAMRERIILPLVVIQHYSIQKLSELDENDPLHKVYSKLITRTIFGIVNAGRNLA
ncbi:phosphoenolpyruvate carboxylase [Albibacterium profundi]|uniref:Phosphoenolpyruvate carboxylase n=1 Tax=Albibacterium profundi TaxID=3134906 RepID=A0ABV5CBL6_9SPHI